MNQGEVLHYLLHFLELEQGGEAALTCRGRGEGEKPAVNVNAEVWRQKEAVAREHSLS